jgi:hypothetical protein
MRDLGVTTWLAHGTLLGWHWGGQFLPWDLDVDMHVFLGEAQSPRQERGLGMSFMARYYNMTVHKYRGVENLLDINPAFADCPEVEATGVDSNRIDARWVDMQTGLYIDITALSLSRDKAGNQAVLRAKDRHAYLEKHVVSQQRSTFEGFDVLVPKAAESMLAQEYGEKSLTMKIFRG